MRQSKASSIGLVLILGFCMPSFAQNAPQDPVSAEELQLNTWIEQLRDPSRSLKTKQEAAEMLLVQRSEMAGDVLSRFLSDSSNRTAQIAVAEAMIRMRVPREQLIDPLLALLNSDDSNVRSAASRALGIFKNHGVSQQLLLIAHDRNRQRGVRLEAIGALRRTMDRSVVDSLVRLLDDEDPTIVSGAVASLIRLTNIRAFGADVDKWRAWWQTSKSKPESEWLAELVEGYAAAKSQLEQENTLLKDRLTKAVEDLYLAAPMSGRDAVLLGMLRDNVADVRLVGLRLLERRTSSSEELSGEYAPLVQLLLTDPDPRIRQISPPIAVVLGGCETSTLLECLSQETVVEVRQSLLLAIGQLANPTALEPVLVEVGSTSQKISAAGAVALGRIALRSELSSQFHEQAVTVLLDRFKHTPQGDDARDLREKLITAMSSVGDEEFVPTFRKSLNDSAATVRLAAVNALRARGNKDLAHAIEPLLADSDRGVRQAALAALGAMGGEGSIELILARTDPEVESDAAVKQQAWNVAMSILSHADADVLKAVLDTLASRSNVNEQRLKVREMLVTALRAKNSDELPTALRNLATDLVVQGRASEASPYLEEAFKICQGSDDDNLAGDIWTEWIAAMLSGNDTLVVKAIAQNPDERMRTQAVRALIERVEILTQAERSDLAIELCSAALQGLTDVSKAHHDKLVQLLDEAREALGQADAKRVHTLCSELGSKDTAARTKAIENLHAMGERARQGLLAELADRLSQDAPTHAVEKVIVELIARIDPGFEYDFKAPIDDRVKMVKSAME